ncbi:hypothetical protein J2Z53_000725 [Clostridium moniliforme]|uniref:Bacterial bifunctional deaminase-reductase C-terminal domain-containing protein n=1 Tax=Clostridium moniliforme TaxID=39489 RepID=A0ABS4EYS3_9CLOT|nr:hypothetical protein [Clostridium moniliforme]MBP1889144.1 hypothetical protein [Clostridium moniliforme]
MELDERKKYNKVCKKTQAYKNNKIIFKGDIEYGKLHSFIIDSNIVIVMGTVILESTALEVPSITAPGYAINNIFNDITYKKYI